MLTSHLEKLAYFAAVAEAGSVSGAARTLRITQPALSRALKVLEEDLGTPLLKRSASGVSVTSAGDILLSAATAMLKGIKDVEKAIQRQSNLTPVNLTLGTKEPLAIHVWPAFLAWLEADRANLNPEGAQALAETMRLTIDKSNARLWRDLKAEKIDLVVVPEPPTEAGYRSILLFYSHIRLYGGGKAALEKPLVCYGDAILKQDVLLADVMKTTSLNRRVIDVQSFDAAREMALKGLGLALLPHWIAKSDETAGRLQELPLAMLGTALKFPRSGIFLCARQSGSMPSQLANFVRSLKAFCQHEFD